MTDRRPGPLARRGIDWQDIAGLLALSALTAGAWIKWDLATALLTFGGVLGAVVLLIVFRPPSNTRR